MNAFERLTAYELRNLVIHLAAAGRNEDLSHLLTLEWAEMEDEPPRRQGLRGWLDAVRGERTTARVRYRNAWQTAKEVRGLSDSYAADLAVALATASTAADRELASGGTAASLGSEVRYALMATSLNELAGRVPPKMLAALVGKGVWTAVQGVSYVRRITDVQARTNSLLALLPVLDEPLRDTVIRETLDALNDLRQTRHSVIRGHWPTPTEIIPFLSAPDTRWVLETFADVEEAPAIRAAAAARLAACGLTGEALDVAATLEHERARADALIAVAPEVEIDAWPRAIEIAESIDYEPWRCEAMGALYARRWGLIHAVEMLDAIDQLAYSRADALARAAAYATTAIRPDLLERIGRLASPEERATALVALTRAANEQSRSARLDEVMVLLAEVSEYRREQLLSELAPFLDGSRLEAALRLAQGAPGATLNLARRLPEPERTSIVRDVVARARKSRDPLAQLIPGGWGALQPAEALAAAAAAGNRRTALEDIAPDLPRDFLSRALTLALSVQDEESEVRTVGGREPWRAVARLVGELSGFEGDEALTIIRATPDEIFRAEALVAAAPHLPQDLVDAALDTALAIRAQEPRGEALGALAPRLPGSRRSEALDACEGSMERVWIAALERFAPYLGDLELDRALDTTAGLLDDAWRGWAVVYLGPWLPERLLTRALQMAHGVRSSFQQVAAVRALACRLAVCGRSAEAIDTIESVWGSSRDACDQWVDGSLAELAPNLDGDDLRRALALVEARSLVRAQAALVGSLDPEQRSAVVSALHTRALQENQLRVDLLVALAPWLAPPALLATIEQTRMSEVVVGLAPYLSQALIAPAAAAVAEEGARSRCLALVALTKRAEGHTRRTLTAQALDAALDDTSMAIIDVQGWADDVCALLRALSPQESHRLLARSLDAGARDTRLKLVAVVRGLAPELARVGGPQTLRTATKAVEDITRWWL